MACENCSKRYPGAIIETTVEGNCTNCGNAIAQEIFIEQLSRERWDKYFYNICEAVASKSSCKSRQIGAILVRDKSITSTGYNGPARGFPHCGDVCPRRAKGIPSGEGLELCPAAHAETNAIANAARIGTSTVGATMYLNTVVPCKFCAVSIVNAGIIEVVVIKPEYYHHISQDIFAYAGVTVRSFEI